MNWLESCSLKKITANEIHRCESARTDPIYDDVLARGIPSMSYAIAVNPVPSLAGNYDMEAMKTWPDSWPTQNHDGRSEGRWLHSDFRDVAINYLRTMYSKMIDLGELNKN